MQLKITALNGFPSYNFTGISKRDFHIYNHKVRMCGSYKKEMRYSNFLKFPAIKF